VAELQRQHTDAAPQERKTGTITRWNIERGFGFIRRDDGRPDLFVHINQVEDHVEDVAVGQRVKFMVGTNPQSSKYEALVVTKTK
jgi:cold shock CspA family protein